MKNKNFLYFVITILFCICLSNELFSASTLDGTSNINYQADHVVLRNSATTCYNKLQGFIRLNNGFTILQDSHATLDTFITISGGMDLRGTATLDLDADLILDSKFTFSGGGKIKGDGNAIILNGNLTLPSNSWLEFITDTVIEGNGHELFLDDYAQLFVDNNVTLTLRNLILKNNKNLPGWPTVKLATHKSKLALENVELDLADDFYFNEGQLFVHQDVVITGTSQFVYRSTQPCRIYSTLNFEPQTTFVYYPATTSKDLVCLQDRISNLFLNGCTLQITHTGLRLTKGRLFCDNKLTFSTAANSLLQDSLTTVTENNTSTNVYSVKWSPNGKYLAVGEYVGAGETKLKVFDFDGSNLNLVDSINYSTYDSSSIKSVDWHPSGKYIAVGGKDYDAAFLSGDELKIYSFDGNSLSNIILQDFTANSNARINTVAWSPDGNYLVIGGDEGSGGQGQYIRIYCFYNVALEYITGVDYNSSQSTTDSQWWIKDIKWNPDGVHLAAVGAYDGDEIRIYSFNGSSFSQVGSGINLGSVSALTCAWSPDGKYLAIGSDYIGTANSNTGQVLRSYSFDGSFLSLLSEITWGTHLTSLDWSPCGKYLLVGGYTPNGSHERLEIYETHLGVLLSTPIVAQAYDDVRSVHWHPTGNYIAVGGEIGTNNEEVTVYQTNYRYDTTQQAFTNSIVFGDYSQGSALYDLDVYVLNSARVALYGKIFYDAIS